MKKQQQPTEATDAQQLIEFPCLFPIKVVGFQTDHFENRVTEVIKPLCKQFDPSRNQAKESRNGKYSSLTCQVRVTSQEQLDSIYRALTNHPEIKFVL